MPSEPGARRADRAADAGLVFDLQDLSLHDGPGLRTVVFLKGCGLRCAWCANPESQEAFPELLHLAVRCRGCLRCQAACPRGAVAAHPTGKPVFRRDLCRACEAKPCLAACPREALRLAGEWWSGRELFQRLAANAPYWRTGGGVTFSGGEPLLQPGFILDFLAAGRESLLQVGVETAGLFSWERAADIFPALEFVFFDLKGLDPTRHRELTGRDNRLILANLARLAGLMPERVALTWTLVPGLGDPLSEARRLAGLGRSLGLSRARLLAYHGLGADKYAQLGRDYALAHLPAVASPIPDQVKKVFLEHGFALADGGETD